MYRIQDFGTATTTGSAGANNIIIGTLEKLSWEWLFVAAWYFCNLDRLLSQFPFSLSFTLIDPGTE